MSAKAPAKGTSAKHATTSKASASSTASKKHAPTAAKKPATAQAKGAKVTTAAKPAKPAKPAGFAIGGLPVCALEAVAQSLRLSGQPVSPDEVVSLWEAAGSPEAGVPIAAALAAFGLSAPPAGTILGVTRPGYHAVLATPDGWWSWGELYSPWTARVEEAWGVSWG